MGLDVTILPKLAAEPDLSTMREKTVEYLKTHDIMGKELFLQTLRLLQKEMKKRYSDVDSALTENLSLIEKIVVSVIEADIRENNVLQ